MKNKLKGKNTEVIKTIYRMIRVSEDIYRRFGVLPYKLQQKHIVWWIEQVGFWLPSEWGEYRYQLAIKKFSRCISRECWI